MRRTLLLVAVLLFVAVGALSVLVNIRSEASEPLPEPDPAMPIVMADGSEMRLSDVLDRVARNEPLPAAPSRPAEPAMVIDPDTSLRFADGSPMTPEDVKNIADALRDAVRTYGDEVGPLQPDVRYAEQFGPTFTLAYDRERAGDYDQAAALYLSIKEDEPGYAHARRRVGWHILAKHGDAARGVRYVQQALIADPMNGNSWQDLSRTYVQALGIPVH